MNCILPRARARPVGMLMLLLILVRQTTSASASNVALQRIEEDKDGNAVKESQLRKKPRLVKAEVEEMEDKDTSSSLTSNLQAHAQFFEGDKDFFEFESEQEREGKMMKRNLSIFGDTEETGNVDIDIDPIILFGCDDTDTADECDLDLDLDDCNFVEDEETGALMCYIAGNKEKDLATLDYRDNPLLFPDISYDYKDAKDEDEAQSSKSGKQAEAGTGDESGRQLKKKEEKKKHENEESESGSELVISSATERARQEALEAIDMADVVVRSASNLRAETRETCTERIAQVRVAVAGSSSGFTASAGAGAEDDFKAINDYFTALAGAGNDLNSEDANVQARAWLRIAAQSARLLDKAVPPLGTILGTVLSIGSLFGPFQNEEGESLQTVIRNEISLAFAEFTNQQLRDQFSNAEGNLETFQRNVELYAQNPSNDSLRANQGSIYLLFNNNNNDNSFTFLGTFGRNHIRNQFRNQINPPPPEEMVDRVISWIRLARGRHTLCLMIADVFSRISTSDDPYDPINQRQVFWETGEIEHLIVLANDVLGDLFRPPASESRGTSLVLQAWYTKQSTAQRLDLENFLQKYLGMRIPGRVLQIRNLYHNQYIQVTEGACPDQVLRSAWGHGHVWRTRGFRRNAMCPYVETTPGAAGLTNTDWNKVFVVYGNGRSFFLWNVGEAAYVRAREPFLPVYVGRNSAIADDHSNWNRFATSRLPLKYQVESPVTSSSQWEFEFSPSNVAPASCNEFTLGRRLNMSFGSGDTIFNRCQWSWSHGGQVEYTIYSTSWETATRNGNGRNRNQVLFWTQQDRRCCATSGQGDRVSQGVWEFQNMDGSVFRLPSSGEL